MRVSQTTGILLCCVVWSTWVVIGCENSTTDDEGLPSTIELRADFDLEEMDMLVYWGNLTCEQECVNYCNKLGECDESGYLTEELLDQCLERCTPDNNFMYPRRLACCRLNDCETFLTCIQNGVFTYYEQFEENAETHTEVVHCDWEQEPIENEEDPEYYPYPLD